MDHLCYMSCVCHAFASVDCCLVVTCWEKADLLAIVFLCLIVFLSLSHVVSRVRCGTRLYRFLIFAAFLTLMQVGQKYCRMLPFAILSTFIKIPFAIQIFVLSNFEWPLYTGLTVKRSEVTVLFP